MKKFVILLFLCLAGCMSMIRQTTDQIKIATEPAGAIAVYEKQNVVTPSYITLPRDEHGIVKITKEGYRDTNVKFKAKPDGGLVVASILLNALHGVPTLGITFVIGLTFDGTRGVLNDFDSNTITVQLVKEEYVRHESQDVH